MLSRVNLEYFWLNLQENRFISSSQIFYQNSPLITTLTPLDVFVLRQILFGILLQVFIKSFFQTKSKWDNGQEINYKKYDYFCHVFMLFMYI